MKKIEYNQFAEEALDAIADSGAFLTVKTEDDLNTMTIGWGSISYMWGKPVFIAMVRDSRYTYELLETTNQFTVSIPFADAMKEELAFCGSKSGREHDKFSECDLNTTKAKEIESPLINGCDVHYECKLRFKQKMDPDNLDPALDEEWYSSDEGYHMFYFGEIVSCHKEE
ncbi:flavin reductase family protein [Halanaerobacter jeridensis]|uniref:Flavin reductase (DIM6/NTAB) family NADH-FMN oxidoreductase RutF n=1 Tax=Halanaerobacter jeridensis TaxID=706427 RepID=A0A938XU38_9FIRM|nr:flavin reductase family protein [Halanaerobacter jeridensis]MBM7557568.1 flavin reductase (DIM6/NTAB) family NADH-FMN oxidoreductase RutF [Halanaerobacter jeridensis]